MMMEKTAQKIVGIDASLTSTGLVAWFPETSIISEEFLFTTTINPVEQRGEKRLIEIRDAIDFHAQDATLVVLEGYAYSRSNQAHQIGELGGQIKVMLCEKGYKYIIVAPTQLKKFATGHGNATKELIAAHVQKRWDKIFPNSDVTDAFVLTEMGKAYLGLQDKPLTKYQETVIKEIKSPEEKKVKK